MSHCAGTVAELSALAYVEGTLPENEAERFEEHYFECPGCLGYLQALQSVRAGLARQAAEPALAPEKPRLLAWRALPWAIGSAAAAAILLIAFAHRTIPTKVGDSSVAQTAPSPAQPAPAVKPPQPAPESPKSATAAELADLQLPAFVAPSLRGSGGNAQFLNAMKAYSRGDCTAALPELAKVDPESRESQAAEFYAGACRLHLGELAAANASLLAVAGAGDSPQQEAAIYCLAQVALKRSDPAAAHKLLEQTIALKGDLENQATAEDRKVQQLLEKKH